MRWRAVEQDQSSVTLECDVSPLPGYPWWLRMRTTWSISSEGLRAEHTAANIGDAPCPFGMGVHPYLFVGDLPVEDIFLNLPTQSRLLVDSRQLPVGAAKVAGSAFDYTAPRRIGTAILDTTFGDVIRDDLGNSTARLSNSDGTSSVEVWADKAFGWWQAFTGDTVAGVRHRRSVALEPMTCPPDAFRSGRDVVTIQPGEVWSGSWGIRPRLGA
jgi:aldose 1-epimerase